MMRISALLISIAWLIAGATPPALAGPTLDKIKAAGTLACGINTELPEYSTQDAHGNHAAFDQDICKAVAVAVLGANAKFIIVPFQDEQDALKALKAGEITLLATGSANFINTGNAGLGFARPIFYDYQGFLVNQTMGINAPKDLAGKKVCFLGGTELEIQLQGYMQRENIKWLPFLFQEEGEMEAAFVTGNCAAISADVSQLAYERLAFKNRALNFVILPDVIAKDPLAPTYRLDDRQWASIVNWTVEALIQAEESGVTQTNLAEMKKSDDPVIRRLLGVQRGYGQFIGLDDAWAARVIEAVGNFGEMFVRDLGSGSVMKLPRGPNNLWTQGGLMYALPMR
ncbi:MAG TPA: transporter substrate-binding domain-containing protein [Candidatus Acidoferrum sp.]|nr:transporter substrate-binding domain-containing protein [Candidatus Acidoferrum sp.]